MVIFISRDASRMQVGHLKKNDLWIADRACSIQELSPLRVDLGGLFSYLIQYEPKSNVLASRPAKEYCCYTCS